jgi:hypothetical protein
MKFKKRKERSNVLLPVLIPVPVCTGTVRYLLISLLMLIGDRMFPVRAEVCDKECAEESYQADSSQVQHGTFFYLQICYVLFFNVK